MSAPVYCYTAEAWLVFCNGDGVGNSKGYCNEDEDRDCYSNGGIDGDGNGDCDSDSNGNGDGDINGDGDGDGKGNGD